MHEPGHRPAHAKPRAAGSSLLTASSGAALTDEPELKTDAPDATVATARFETELRDGYRRMYDDSDALRAEFDDILHESLPR